MQLEHGVQRRPDFCVSIEAMTLLNRSLAEGIRCVGFRKWYERELLSSHAHMLLAFLSVIALMASMEAFHGATTNQKLINVCLVIVSAGVGLWALRRYLYLLMHAEEVANQANCPGCAAYGRLTLIDENRRNGDALVCCKKCARQWTISP
ncbi:MAG: hypothetical protein ABIN37_14695 [Burkholderiaceae bacterium]